MFFYQIEKLLAIAQPFDLADTVHFEKGLAVLRQLAKSDPEFLFELLKIVIDRLIIAELNVKKLTNAQED